MREVRRNYTPGSFCLLPYTAAQSQLLAAVASAEAAAFTEVVVSAEAAAFVKVHKTGVVGFGRGRLIGGPFISQTP